MNTPAVSLLRQARTNLEQAAVERLASGMFMRESVASEVTRFYDLLEDALESGHGEWMDPILNDWVQARLTQSRAESELLPVLQQLKTVTWDVLRQELTTENLIKALYGLEPIFDYAVNKLTTMETEAFLAESKTQLLEAQYDLERLDKSKSDFIAVAAHELKTPLTLIEGYTNILGAELTDADGGRTDIILRGMSNGTRRLKEIIEDMVDVSMIDNDMLNLNFQPVNIEQLFDIVASELSDALKERKLTFTVKPFDPDARATYADSERLYQVFMNVISNAIKFTPDGGCITISGRALPGFAEVTIADTGIGIAPENQVRIFEKFSQTGDVSLHSSGKTKFKGGGPGLGLAIAKGIIEGHGGTIWCDSPGYDEQALPGSTFHVMVPLRDAPPESHTTKLFGLTSEDLNQLAALE